MYYLLRFLFIYYYLLCKYIIWFFLNKNNITCGDGLTEKKNIFFFYKFLLKLFMQIRHILFSNVLHVLSHYKVYFKF